MGEGGGIGVTGVGKDTAITWWVRSGHSLWERGEGLQSLASKLKGVV